MAAEFTVLPSFSCENEAINGGERRSLKRGIRTSYWTSRNWQCWHLSHPESLLAAAKDSPPMSKTCLHQFKKPCDTLTWGRHLEKGCPFFSEPSLPPPVARRPLTRIMSQHDWVDKYTLWPWRKQLIYQKSWRPLPIHSHRNMGNIYVGMDSQDIEKYISEGPLGSLKTFVVAIFTSQAWL